MVQIYATLAVTHSKERSFACRSHCVTPTANLSSVNCEQYWRSVWHGLGESNWHGWRAIDRCVTTHSSAGSLCVDVERDTAQTVLGILWGGQHGYRPRIPPPLFIDGQTVNVWISSQDSFFKGRDILINHILCVLCFVCTWILKSMISTALSILFYKVNTLDNVVNRESSGFLFYIDHRCSQPVSTAGPGKADLALMVKESS